MRDIRPHQHGAALHPCISGPASDQQGSVHHHNQLKTVVAVTGSCEARSHHDHRGGPCKRATIWTNEHTSRGFAVNSRPLISASIFKTAWQLECYFFLSGTCGTHRLLVYRVSCLRRGGKVRPQILLAISVACGFLVWGIVTSQYVWLALRSRPFLDARADRHGRSY